MPKRKHPDDVPPMPYIWSSRHDDPRWQAWMQDGVWSKADLSTLLFFVLNEITFLCTVKHVLFSVERNALLASVTTARARLARRRASSARDMDGIAQWFSGLCGGRGKISSRDQAAARIRRGTEASAFATSSTGETPRRRRYRLCVGGTR